MAIYHLTVKTLGRTKNHKAVAAAAYRSGTKLQDQRYDMVHDYTKKSGIVHSEILTPENTPSWASDREKLWNEVEATEKRKDAQVAREVEFALPRELTTDENLELSRQFVREEMVSRGMVADLAIHARNSTDGQGNPHAHVMLTMRRINSDGFGPKERDWNKTELVEAWRSRWAALCNTALENAGVDARIDHRTLEAQGIMREPTVHLGKEAFYAERSGEIIESERKQQPSMVERAVAPYEKQIEANGQITMTMTPEAGNTWWERTVSFTKRVAERAQEWYGQKRDALREWAQQFRPSNDGPNQSPTR